MSKIDITTQEWNDLVFAGRNKQYGGYVLRNTSNKRHIFALIVVLAVAIVLFYAPKIFKLVLPQGDRIETIETSTEMTNLDQPDDQPQEDIEIPEVKKLPELRKTIAFTAPKIVPAEEVKEVVSNDDVFEEKAAVSDVTQEGKNDYEIPKDVHEKGPETPKKDSTYTLANVQKKPSFPGGEPELYKFIGKNLRYPAGMAENGVQGKVYVEFLVSKSGKVVNIRVVKTTVTPDGDKEAVRVIGEMPPWIPGEQNGEPVQVLYIMPINYKLQ
ncbi:MAG: TonB family protein [Prevotellaceae bacterium]|jgi:protein TonB|nr:TonB family protein [Prevotellaceae bacterium]